MIPYKTIIQLDRKGATPVYVQLCNQIIQLIKRGILLPATQLPGSRLMAETLHIHRKTVVAAYEELMAQGWIEVRPAKGTYVHTSLPIVQQQPIREVNSTERNEKVKRTSGFSFIRKPHLNRPDVAFEKGDMLTIDEGVPDTRIAPIEEIARMYRNTVKKSYNRKHLSYGSIYGNRKLRETLVGYLNETRGLNIHVDNILITRGSQMGIYLSSQLLLGEGENIVVGDPNYRAANKTFLEAGAILNKVEVDEKGIVTDVIQALCTQKKIKAVYVTSHHHHPTTVTLSAQRRMHLLELSQTYNFAVIEDDYDYDFHYNNAPILPLASGDTHGNVIYIGALSKIVAPAIRIGYLIAPKDFVDEAARFRRVVDRQGDPLLELTMARMIKEGEIQRHSKKALKIYRARRDLFCSLLQEKLSDYLDFTTPEGGMAVWVKLHKKYDWEKIRKEASKHGVKLVDYRWDTEDTVDTAHNGMRMGFASLTPDEIQKVIDRLETTMKALEKVPNMA